MGRPVRSPRTRRRRAERRTGGSSCTSCPDGGCSIQEERMRGLITLGLGLVVGGAPLAAQHVNQFELGLFGAYTKYDKTLNLSSRMGGGAAIRYFQRQRVAAERDGVFGLEQDVAGGSTMEPLI